jgi:hypothetical protein
MRNVLVPQLFAAAMALAVVHPQQGAAAVPPVDGKGRGAFVACPATLAVPAIYHFDKIVFELDPQFPLPAASPADQPALDKIPRGVPLDIKVVDDPRTVADLQFKVLVFLGAIANVDTRRAVKITSVLYATAVCNPKGW